jgi:hypothetical protein
MAISMSHPCPFMNRNFSRQQITRNKIPIVQTTMAFIGKQDYDQLHIDDVIVNTKG